VTIAGRLAKIEEPVVEVAADEVPVEGEEAAEGAEGEELAEGGDEAKADGGDE